MMGRLVALGAAAVAAVAATGAAVRARRRPDRRAGEPETKPTQAASTKGAATRQDTSPRTPAAAGAPAAGDAAGDDLTALKGIGAVSAERLGSSGVTTLAQIAAWTDEDIESLATAIKVSPERIRREDWVGQARASLED